jgi:NarL family two-component system response regulator LiaR
LRAKIKVLIVDDNPVVRRGTSLFIMGSQDMEWVGEACDGKEAIAQAEALQPDVILMDLEMPEMNGVEASREILGRQPAVRILIVTGNETHDQILAAVRVGAVGYVAKDADIDELLEAIRRVHRGGLYLPSVITSKLLEQGPPPEETPPFSPSTLTQHQIEILQWLAKDLSSRQIAMRIGVRESTVRSHISHAVASLGFASQSDLQRAFWKASLGEPSGLSPEMIRRILPESLEIESLGVESLEVESALTLREVEILQALAAGLSNERIGERMSISEATVRTHLNHLFAKLGVASRLEAALYALRQGWASL